MDFAIFPYVVLLFAILAGYLSTIRAALFFLLTAVVLGVFSNRLSWISFLGITSLGLTLWLPRKFSLQQTSNFFCYFLFLVLSIALWSHILPGFNNLPIYQGIRFSPDSVPFSMYLNFDKTLIGFFIILFFTRTSFRDLKFESIKKSLIVLSFLLATLLPLAIGIQYVHFDFKFPELVWIWILNNLFFVCLAEEGLFRGFIQAGLENILPKSKKYSVVSILIAATLFGLAHYKGGLAYITHATIAGLFYGYAFQKTKRLEASIIVHFGLNLIHFLFFSYPALAH